MPEPLDPIAQPPALTERREVAHDPPAAPTRLALRAGTFFLLAPVAAVVEVMSPVAVCALPGTREWLLGLANLRGNLCTVTDLSHFLGLPHSPIDAQSKLIVLRRQPRPQFALLVDQVLGIRDPTRWRCEPAAEARAWLGPPLYDPTGRCWRELYPDVMVSTPEFLDVAL